MKEIANKIWNEPAVFIGLLITVVLAVGAIITNSDWGWETIVAVLGPLLSSLGIRPLVTPNAKVAVTTEGEIPEPPDRPEPPRVVRK